MKNAIRLTCLFFLMATAAWGQSDSTFTGSLVDVVWLKDGSRLVGSITRWELDHGLELKLASGAIMTIPKRDISQVFQQVKPGAENALIPIKVKKPYAFKERGLYHQLSMFFHGSENYGGSGIQYALGYRFNRLFSLGVGAGYETNEIGNGRDLMPIFAEVRGFLKAEKVTPYYGLKIGHSIADNDSENDFIFSETGKGGIYISPEIGLRVGAQKVSFFFGAEYKYQEASYLSDWGPDFQVSDNITYKRIALRTGILF
jgi:hypothetical protein